MQQLLAIPLPVRLALVFVIAACVASLANAAIYQFAWRRRLRSPWQTAPEGVIPRTWLDCVPILGWWRLRRESQVHGAAHWLRPLLIELLFPLGMAWLYWWETTALGLLVDQAAGGLGAVDTDALAGPLHLQFLAHGLLAWLMLGATFIDVDDRIIPDEITVTGTLLGLMFMTLAPIALLPQLTAPKEMPIVGQELVTRAGNPTGILLEPVHLAASSEWPAVLNGAPHVNSLAIGLACYWLWCFAFVRRRWVGVKGLAYALRFFAARVTRDLNSRPLREVTVIGSLAVLGVWFWGGPAWVGLLTSLVGLAGSGGIVWLIRVFAGVALRREAMGFGDVLLMMMVGTFIGWQAGVIVFFLAPFAAIVFGVVQLVTRRENELPYGPFLCAATMVVIVRWGVIWEQARLVFNVPWLVPVVLLICLVLCGAILAVWQAIKDRLLAGSGAE